MEYYIVKQDPQYVDAPRLVDMAEKVNVNHFLQNKMSGFAQHTVLYAESNPSVDFIDFIQQRVPLLSSKAMDAIEPFEQKWFKKQFVIFEFASSQDDAYNLLFLPRFTVDKNIERVDMEELFTEEEAQTYPLFYLFEGAECHVVMRLDVVECLVRNGCRGFTLTPILSKGE